MNRKEKTCTTNRSTGFGGKTVSRERSGIALASDATKRKKPALLIVAQVLAGETRFEHATSGFGDRCSTVEPLP